MSFTCHVEFCTDVELSFAGSGLKTTRLSGFNYIQPVSNKLNGLLIILVLMLFVGMVI
jgi:hypothetical protein